MSETDTTPLKGNWDLDFPREKDKPAGNEGTNVDGRKVVYMDTKNPGEYRVRLAGPYVSFLKWWEPIRGITHKSYETKDPAWVAGFKPQLRYAINVIDRADGKLKVLEAGSQIFKAIANCARTNNIDPAGKEGPDFTISVVIPRENGKPNPRRKTYTVQPTIKSIPFTAEEVAMIKEQKLYPLSKIYKAYTLERLNELWAKVPAAQRVPESKTKDGEESSREENETQTQVAAVENVSVGEGGDLFEEADATASSADLF